MSTFLAVLRRDLIIAFRQRGTLVHHFLFFVLIVAMFPLGTNTDQAVLVATAPALIWMAVLLSVLLSLQRLFRADYEDGTLTQYLIAPEPLAIIALAKVTAYWIGSALVFVVAAPLLVLLLGVPARTLGVMALALALGTPVLALVGAIGTALTLSLPRAGLLVSLLVFPLYVPVLIFGAGAMRAATVGLPYASALYMLGILLILAVTGAPWAIAAALHISTE